MQDKIISNRKVLRVNVWHKADFLRIKILNFKFLYYLYVLWPSLDRSTVCLSIIWFVYRLSVFSTYSYAYFSFISKVSFLYFDQVNFLGVQLVSRSVLKFYPYKNYKILLQHSCSPTKLTWSVLLKTQIKIYLYKNQNVT